jgi:hypothetical protein
MGSSVDSLKKLERKYAKTHYAGKLTKWFARCIDESERLERMQRHFLLLGKPEEHSTNGPANGVPKAIASCRSGTERA